MESTGELLLVCIILVIERIYDIYSRAASLQVNKQPTSLKPTYKGTCHMASAESITSRLHKNYFNVTIYQLLVDCWTL